MALVHDLVERVAIKSYTCPGCNGKIQTGERCVRIDFGGSGYRYAHLTCGRRIMEKRAKQAGLEKNHTGKAGPAANGRVIRSQRGLR